jgi:hypothetical protein
MGQIFVKAYRRAKAFVKSYVKGSSKISKLSVRTAAQRSSMAKAASARAKKIQEARLKALSNRSYGGRFGGLK